MRKSKKTKIFSMYFFICFVHRPLIMGCYGIGLTRLMAATVEVLTPKQSNGIRWPRRIVPYQVAILPPKVRYYFLRLENILRQSLLF
jgi:prolyl-tRNA synthetase